MAWGGPKVVELVLLVEAIIPLGDMLTILAPRGSARSAFGIHGFTAVLMLLAGVPLVLAHQ
jgi:hypothetical protein